jgi:ribonuclease BN (tRNA processing enzyme)
MPTDDRETCCALLRNGTEALLIDAGTGARRLVTDPSLLAGVERLHVVLTHFHLDHTVGLFYLADADATVEIWGAGEVLEGTPTSELINRLLGSPFAPPSIGSGLTVHELSLPAAEVGSFQVESRVQSMHSNRSLALRTAGLVWCTDTGFDPENVEFARGSRVLFHEAFRPADTTEGTGHTAAGDAGRIAAAAGVDRLVLIHVVSGVEDRALLDFALPQFAATDVGRDGLVVPLS